MARVANFDASSASGSARLSARLGAPSFLLLHQKGAHSPCRSRGAGNAAKTRLRGQGVVRGLSEQRRGYAATQARVLAASSRRKRRAWNCNSRPGSYLVAFAGNMPPKPKNNALLAQGVLSVVGVVAILAFWKADAK